MNEIIECLVADNVPSPIAVGDIVVVTLVGGSASIDVLRAGEILEFTRLENPESVSPILLPTNGQRDTVVQMLRLTAAACGKKLRHVDNDPDCELEHYRYEVLA